MANMTAGLVFLASIFLFNTLALSSQLIWINGKGNGNGNDNDLGTDIFSDGGGNYCESSGNLIFKGESYPQYTCSPPESSMAILTMNDFSEGGNGGGPSRCDNQYHDNSELVVALSTGWYKGGSSCGRMISITATSNGRSVTAKVVDECDSVNGCDDEHAGQPPCRNNIVDGSKAVWDAIGLDSGEEQVTWSVV